MHALWTLEGLGVVDKGLIKAKFTDEDPRVRLTAIRLSETFLKKDDTDIFAGIRNFKQGSRY
ncbi:hypothetical protein [Cellulophaga baltica]|uniref:hypothetical protein n=1 Tax=Cellulophaga baltica TaxID=76594 RepID=UPI00068D7D26|nr:hypothetical protein [Cellulophaga baltica]